MVEVGTTPSDRDWLGQMLALQREIRGEILGGAIQVERALDLILANHFCEPQGERWWQLYSLVLASGGVSFRRKKEIVIELLGTAYPGLLEQHPRVKAGLERIVKKRNEIAHSESGMSAGFGTGQPPDHINLILYRNGGRVIKRLTLADARQEQQATTALFLELAAIAAVVRHSG